MAQAQKGVQYVGLPQEKEKDLDHMIYAWTGQVLQNIWSQILVIICEKSIKLVHVETYWGKDAAPYNL